MKTLINIKTRRYLYSVCTAVTLALSVVGVINSEWLQASNIVFTAVFGMAVINTPNETVVNNGKHRLKTK